jgi:hypothetical protein
MKHSCTCTALFAGTTYDQNHTAASRFMSKLGLPVIMLRLLPCQQATHAELAVVDNQLLLLSTHMALQSEHCASFKINPTPSTMHNYIDADPDADPDAEAKRSKAVGVTTVLVISKGCST